MNKQNASRRSMAFLRWAILLGCIALGLLYLNSAVFSAWVAGGPPTDYPESWLHRAVLRFCIAVALFLVGTAAFRWISRLPSIDRWSVALFLIAGVVLSIPLVREHMVANSCVNSGGQWDRPEFRCKK